MTSPLDQDPHSKPGARWCSVATPCDAPDRGRLTAREAVQQPRPIGVRTGAEDLARDAAVDGVRTSRRAGGRESCSCRLAAIPAVRAHRGTGAGSDVPYTHLMRSRSASATRRLARLASMTPDERVRLAMRLGEDGLSLYMSTHGVDRRTATARIKATRRLGRRPSACAQADER